MECDEFERKNGFDKSIYGILSDPKTKIETNKNTKSLGQNEDSVKELRKLVRNNPEFQLKSLSV